MLVFVLGTIIGSFLNVVGLRLNSGSTLKGRSLCFSCGKKLRWWELIPVVSFFVIKGRCSGCRSKISWQYPLVELWTGILFLSLYMILGNIGIDFAILAISFCMYTVILIYDLKHKIIPNKLVYTSFIPAIIYAINSGYNTFDLIAGPIIFIFFGTIWLVSRGKAVGLGDAKLGASIGFLLGMSKGMSALVLSFWIGSVFVLLYMLVQKVSVKKSLLTSDKRLTMKSEIPFGPFLVLAAWISFFFNLDIFHVALF